MGLPSCENPSWADWLCSETGSMFSWESECFDGLVPVGLYSGDAQNRLCLGCLQQGWQHQVHIITQDVSAGAIIPFQGNIPPPLARGCLAPLGTHGSIC